MYKYDYLESAQKHPKIALVLCCILWKISLLSLALISPGVGYDTSTDVLFATPSHRANPFSHCVKKLVRWDAIYFSQIAQRGQSFEQEWAFGWGFMRMLGLGGKGRNLEHDLVSLLTAKSSLTFTMINKA